MISSVRLKSILNYNPETGAWTWISKVGWPAKSMQRAETPHIKDQFLWIYIAGRMYQAHVLAFFYMTGEWPSGEIEFNNCVRHDNRWSNLRLVPKGTNSLNRKTAATNTSGYKGVHWDSTLCKWRVRFQNCGKRISVGCYDSLEEASAAYAKASVENLADHLRIKNM